MAILFILAVLLPTSAWAGFGGFLENPALMSDKSGISVVSGWRCEAGTITVSFDGGPPLEASYGSSRADTEAICGHSGAGFVLLWNYNILGDGPHTIRVFDNGTEFDGAMFTVTTLGAEFLRGASGTYRIRGFPGFNENVVIEWDQSSQNFVITAKDADPLASECIPEPTDMFFEYGDFITCGIENPGDPDIFRFFGQTGDRVLISTSDIGPTTGFYPCIELIAPDGGTVTESCEREDSQQIDSVLDSIGTYTIIISEGAGFDQTGRYSVSLTCLLGTCARRVCGDAVPQ